MSEVASSGSAVLAGNPAGVSQSADSISVEAVTPYQPQQQAPTWHADITDADLRGYVENKGWRDPVELANGYRNLEKLLGSEKIPMPKGADDAEGWGRVYDSLGRPKSADEYKIGTPEGPTEFSKAAAGKFYELGLSANQAEALSNWYNEELQSQMSAVQQQSAQKSEAELSGLRSEWGKAFDENVELGRRAVREFELGDKLGAIENAIGTAEMMKLMARMGRGLTEHTFEGGKQTQGFGMTPAGAAQRIEALKNDKEWASKYISGNADAQQEMARLMSIAYPEG